VACTYGWFPNSAEFGLKGLSPNHQQGKSPSRLGLDLVAMISFISSPHNLLCST